VSSAKRIVLTTHGTLGDLHPYLALALELRERGHRPVIATSEYYRRKVESAGIAFHAIRPDSSFDDRELHRRLIDPKRGMERAIREVMFPALRATYDDLLDAVQKDGGADLLVSQILIFAAPVVAEKTGLPWVSTELQPGAFLSRYDPPVLSAIPSLAKLRPLGPMFHGPIFRVARWVGHAWGEPVRRLRRELGLAPGGNPLFEGRHSPRRVLALFSRIIGAPQPDWPPNTLVTGFPFHDEPSSVPALPDFLDDGDPPIVFTLGSSAVWDAGTFYEKSIAAARKLGKRAVLLVGDNPLQSSPSSILSIPYAPYAQLFPRAAAIVHQGGIGTTAQALRAGKPMLVMPFGSDQYDNAARVERLGAGRAIMRRRYTADRAAAALRELLEHPQYRENAAAAGRHLQAENGVRAACDALEEQA
jgi:rhamnosyltransferase subunit B